jgi:hypothetical protein
VENGVLIGTTVDGSSNTFLAIGPFKDFELEFEVKVDDELNSGVQVRSHIAKEGDPAPEGSKGGNRCLPAVSMVRSARSRSTAPPVIFTTRPAAAPGGAC